MSKDGKQVIVALTGLKGSGKTTVAQFLCDDFGFVRRAFADPLKGQVAAMLQWVDMAYPLIGPGPQILKTIDDHLEAMRAPDKKEQYRGIMQWFGTEYRRAQDPEYWIKQMRGAITYGNAPRIVIDDLRFPNEAQMVRELGGHVIRLRARSSTINGGFEDVHASERPDLIPADLDLLNDLDWGKDHASLLATEIAGQVLKITKTPGTPNGVPV